MEVNLEQLVYGSFAFRAGGYEVLARSSGCSPALTAELVAVCRRFGQPPSSEAAQPGLVAIRLPSGPWAVIGVAPQGEDDRGRPGALAFHALIVPERDYRGSRFNPFAFAVAHRGDWSRDTPGELPRVRCSIDSEGGKIPVGPDLKVRRIVQAITKGRRVALESSGPIDALAREVWGLLPTRARSRASVATWAFAGENRFDLVAFPRLAGVTLDRTYIASASLDAPEPPIAEPYQRRPKPKPIHLINAPGAVPVALGGIAVVVALTLAWGMQSGRSWWRPPAAVVAPVAIEPPAPPELTAAEASRVQAGLIALADRFGAFDLGSPTEPGAMLARLADGLHYHGRILTPSERDALAADPDPSKARALLWHDQIARFRDDQPWPGKFGELSVSRQLRAVARSFHLDPKLTADAIPGALIAALSRPGLVQPTPLAARFPALSEYARFLGKLPRADDPPASETDR